MINSLTKAVSSYIHLFDDVDMFRVIFALYVSKQKLQQPACRGCKYILYTQTCSPCTICQPTILILFRCSTRAATGVGNSCNRTLTRNGIRSLPSGFFEGLDSLRYL